MGVPTTHDKTTVGCLLTIQVQGEGDYHRFDHRFQGFGDQSFMSFTVKRDINTYIWKKPGRVNTSSDCYYRSINSSLIRFYSHHSNLINNYTFYRGKFPYFYPQSNRSFTISKYYFMGVCITIALVIGSLYEVFGVKIGHHASDFTWRYNFRFNTQRVLQNHIFL